MTTADPTKDPSPAANAVSGAAAVRRAAEVRELEHALAGTEGTRKWIPRLLVVGAIGAAVFGWTRWRAAHPPPRPPKYLTDEASVGDLAEVIQSTGTLQPTTKVDVGAQVSGRIAKRHVDFNSIVKKGDLLAEIDPTVYQANVAADAARISTAKAAIEGDKASIVLAQANYDRVVGLAAQGLAGTAEVTTNKGALDAAKAKLHASEAQLALAGASLTTSQTNLAFCKIYAPIDGIVISRSIDVGQTVAASFQAPVLFTIAQDLRAMLVLADVDEADLGRLTAAKAPTVEVSVAAFAGDVFPGKLTEIRFAPTTTQGIVTYPAVISVQNPEIKLRPGMTATVNIKTAVVKSALRVPNAALRYKPAPPLGPDGKPKPVKPEAPPPKGKARVYLPGPHRDDLPTAVVVDVGISDGAFTEVVSGLTSGQKVVVDETDDNPDKGKPRMF